MMIIMMILLSGVLWLAFFAWFRYTGWKVDPIQWMDCKLSHFVNYFCRHYSSTLLVIMAMEKLFALYFPLKSKTVCTVKTAKWVTGIVAFIFFGYDVQYLVLYKSVKTNTGGYCIIHNRKYFRILDRVDSIIYSFGTFTIMLLVNCAIIAKFMKAKCQSIFQNSTESTSQALNKYATKGTAMVVTVSVTFIVLTAPVGIDQVMGRKLTPYPLYFVFMISMQYLNHSINGVLYCIVGTKFREELLKLFKCHRNTAGSTTHESTVSTVTM